MLFLCVSKWYRYRLRDEVVNEQFLVEEIYERQIALAEEYEREQLEIDKGIVVRSQQEYGSLEQ